MYSFKSSLENSLLLRAYTLKYSYEESRNIQKSKGHNQMNHQIMSNCIIIRKKKTKNETDFGYKEQLKTNILKKINFVYIENIEDLIAFIWKHNQIKEILFGILIIENIQEYFGQQFDYRECGANFLIFIKLLRQLVNKIRIKGRVCITYLYNSKIFNKGPFQYFIRGEDIIDWEIQEKQMLKNGEKYESQTTKIFFENYSKIKEKES